MTHRNVARKRTARMYWRALICLAATFLAAPAARAQSGVGDGQWPSYGGDLGSTKYSSLDQIDRDNVGDLQVVWRWKAVNSGSRPLHNYEATPLMVGGVLYVSTGLGEAAAIDPATGETIWVFTPPIDPDARPQVIASRGVSYWMDQSDRSDPSNPSAAAEARIFLVTNEARLVALDAKTGKQIADFGDGGDVNLKEGLGRPVRGRYGVSSPPVICRDVVVVGSAISDAASGPDSPPGHVRGFDARTGAMRWIFHTIPQAGEYGVDTWREGSWRTTGNTNVWAPMSADDELGYVYLPVTTPTSDWYGGSRPGDNYFAESLVCLDAATGARVWHFQMVHHGLWDYDLPAAPTLLDITVDGRPIKAVAQVSKQGFCYVFDRVTGKPVWPIEERPVVQSDVPGEHTSATQPHPTKPPPFERQGISVDDLIDFTPELRAQAIEILNQYRSGPLFMPPSLLEEGGTKGTLNLPGWGGGASWTGAAADPETGILYVPSIAVPIVVALSEPQGGRSRFRYIRGGERYVEGPRGLPLLKPPYGQITAIDLNRGETLWQRPNGVGPEVVRDHPALEGLDLPPMGQQGRAAPLLTKTLLFVGEGGGLRGSAVGAGGPIFRAYDKSTGEIVAEIELPGNTTGAPMTYRHEGKQYIVIAIATKELPAELVALGLP